MKDWEQMRNDCLDILKGYFVDVRWRQKYLWQKQKKTMEKSLTAATVRTSGNWITFVICLLTN